MDEIMYVGAGFISALIFCFVLVKATCRFGELQYLPNPEHDPDNPYILRFLVDPSTWLRGKYVVLKIRK